MFKFIGKREAAQEAIDRIRENKTFEYFSVPRTERIKAAIITIKDTKTGEVFKFPFKDLEEVAPAIIKNWEFVAESMVINKVMYTSIDQGFMGWKFKKIKEGAA